ncbi:MAG TPA: hypothetical protein VK809_02775 [Bacteroidia bacterium]|jgi:hypothetical protein|nr:hypothetical protein [Bacteroidia bacterium]
MKFLATILLFYFSSLIAQPVVTLVHNTLSKEKEVCIMQCCQKHQTQKKQAQKLPFGCCANDMSNPFAQCCCCTGFIPEKQNCYLVIVTNSTIQVETYTGVLIPNYSSDCWRPPEMAV